MNELGKIKNQIQEIDMLLSNEMLFKEFIKEIETEEQRYDVDISNTSKKEYTYSFIDILKVACFAIAAVIMWEFGISRLPDIQIENKIYEEGQYEEFNKNFNIVSKKFMGIDFKGGEER